MATETLDAMGMKCPKPLFEVSKRIRQMEEGEELEVFADDPAFKPDIEAWCRRTGNELVDLVKEEKRTVATIKKTA